MYPSTDSSTTYFGISIMPVKTSVAFVGCVSGFMSYHVFSPSTLIDILITKRMFTFYAGQTVGGSNASMDKAEYFRFIKECRLHNISKQKLDTVFQRANAGEDKTQSGNKNLQLSRDTDELFNPDNELVPHEFLEALLRLACIKFRKHDLPLSEKLINLLRTF